MTNLPPLLRDQRKTDVEQLKLLAIFHFVLAGMAIFGLGFLFLHYTIMHQAFSHPGMWKNQRQSEMQAEEFFAAFKWFYFFFGGLLVLGGIGNLLSGFFIRQRKHRIFSLIVAGLNCFHLPMGIALGVFTFVVLLRDSVRELYDFHAGVTPRPDPNPAESPVPQNPLALIRPEDRVPVTSSPPPVAEPSGDATGGLIPYKNPPALMAYYAGVFSIIPFFGFFFGIAGLWLGIAGLRRRKQHPIIRGAVHAWIGIVCGSLSIIAHLVVVVLIARLGRR